MLPDLGALRGRLSSLGTGLNDVLDNLRELSRGLHPAVLSQDGLTPALARWRCGQRFQSTCASTSAPNASRTTSKWPPTTSSLGGADQHRQARRRIAGASQRQAV